MSVSPDRQWASRLPVGGRGNSGAPCFSLASMSSQGVRVIADVTDGGKESPMAMPGLGGLLDGIPVRTMHPMGGDREMQRTCEQELRRVSAPLPEMITFTVRVCGHADSASVLEGVGVT